MLLTCCTSYMLGQKLKPIAETNTSRVPAPDVPVPEMVAMKQSQLMSGKRYYFRHDQVIMFVKVRWGLIESRWESNLKDDRDDSKSYVYSQENAELENIQQLPTYTFSLYASRSPLHSGQ